jgi:hypothetical protein
MRPNEGRKDMIETDIYEVELHAALQKLANYFDYDATGVPEAVRNEIEAIRSLDPMGCYPDFASVELSVLIYALNTLATMLSIEKGWTPRIAA